jgi:precorrin-6B methylase 1
LNFEFGRTVYHVEAAYFPPGDVLSRDCFVDVQNSDDDQKSVFFTEMIPPLKISAVQLACAKDFPNWSNCEAIQSFGTLIFSLQQITNSKMN